MDSPTYTHDDVLIVLEGRRRLAWSGPDNGTAAPTGLWPDPQQHETLQDHLAGQAPLLVLVGRDTEPVPLLPEEVSALPPALLGLLVDHDGQPALRIPLLDWLPEPLRRRGMAFLAGAEAKRTATPALLLPELMVDQDTGSPVRFARLTGSRPLSRCSLGAAIGHMFAQHHPSGPNPRPSAPSRTGQLA